MTRMSEPMSSALVGEPAVEGAVDDGQFLLVLLGDAHDLLMKDHGRLLAPAG